MHFIAMIGLSAICSGQGAITVFLCGLSVSIVWVLPAIAGTYLFANRSLKLLAIYAGMYVVLFVLSGLIFGVL